MKLKFLLLTLIIALIFSCQTSKPYSNEMKLNLVEMFQKDQNLQDWDSNRLNDKVYIDSMNFQFNNLIRENTKVVKKYYEDFGYPYIKKNGQKTERYFWVIVQHSDHDVKFQEKILKKMKKGLGSGNVTTQNYAYLYDRVKKNRSLPQLYGTQVEYVGWDVVPYKLKFPEKVDKLRKDVGLDSLKLYLSSFHN